MALGYSKVQKLKNRSDIGDLFSGASKTTEYPITLIYHCKGTENQNKFGVSVGKKRIKLAVNRNKIKRLLRESYRLHQDFLPKKEFHIFAIYLAKEELPYTQIEQAMKKSLQKVAERNLKLENKH